jgi:hypothetical protein
MIGVKMNNSKIEAECEEILRTLVYKYGFLHPQCEFFGRFDQAAAVEVVDAIIKMIKNNPEIMRQARINDWGK